MHLTWYFSDIPIYIGKQGFSEKNSSACQVCRQMSFYKHGKHTL